MARMIPYPMRPGTESEAERFLYRKFEDELPSDWTVIHQARWIGRRRGREGQDGEADFLVVHPAKGILVLEAKGGEIEIDGRTGRFVQRRGHSERELKQNPIDQASDSKHALFDLLLGVRGLRGRQLHMVHAMALPHVTVPASGLGPAAPRERVIDANDVQSLLAAIHRALESTPRLRPDLPDLGPDGVESLVDAVAVQCRLRVHTPTISREVRSKLADLTDEQYDVLHTLASVPRARITGGPGTGKTLLAIEAARRFAAQGLETLFLCFNAPLGGFLRTATEGVEGLVATHFHGLCRALAEEAGLAARIRAAETPDGYAHVFPELLLEAVELLDRRFDALVVDEAQDFNVTWWTALECCLRDGGQASVYLFEDEEQTLDDSETSERPAGLVGPLCLTRDCRNTDEIHAFLAACPGGLANVRPSGVSSGVLPRVTWIDEPGRIQRMVSRTVARLVQEWAVPPDEVAVLTARAAPKSALGKVERLGPAPVSWRKRESERHVLIDTLHRFKGLEATAVVVAEITPDVRPDLATCLRVGCSRPTVHLDLLAARETEEALRNALPHAEVQ